MICHEIHDPFLEKVFSIPVREEIESQIVQLPTGSFACTTCDYNNPIKNVVYKHIDSKHMDFVYTCPYCGKENPTNHVMSMHIRRQHKS